MIKLKEIVDFLNEYLKNKEFEDNSWNGLQVEGREEISKIAFCVTAGLEVFQKAKDEGADMIVAHHGIFWKEANPSIKGWTKERVVFLMKNNISFYASHLPLDAHPEDGNNARIMKLLEGKIEEPMALHKGKNIGWIGRIEPITVKDIVRKLESSLDTKCIVLDRGKEMVERVAVVSGGAPYDVFEAIEKEADLFITGDAADVLEVVKDAKINVIFAGHYATETTGVKALSDLIKNKFGIETVFINAPTGL